jgi:hypothetical protein
MADTDASNPANNFKDHPLYTLCSALSLNVSDIASEIANFPRDDKSLDLMKLMAEKVVDCRNTQLATVEELQKLKSISLVKETNFGINNILMLLCAIN